MKLQVEKNVQVKKNWWFTIRILTDCSLKTSGQGTCIFNVSSFWRRRTVFIPSALLNSIVTDRFENHLQQYNFSAKKNSWSLLPEVISWMHLLFSRAFLTKSTPLWKRLAISKELLKKLSKKLCSTFFKDFQSGQTQDFLRYSSPHCLYF